MQHFRHLAVSHKAWITRVSAIFSKNSSYCCYVSHRTEAVPSVTTEIAASPSGSKHHTQPERRLRGALARHGLLSSRLSSSQQCLPHEEAMNVGERALAELD